MTKEKRPKSIPDNSSKNPKTIIKSLTHDQLIVFNKPKTKPGAKPNSTTGAKPNNKAPKKG